MRERQPIPPERQEKSGEPPEWLLGLAGRLQQRLDSVVRWFRGGGRQPAGEGGSAEADAERARADEAAFERKWGIYYKPLAFLVVLWLVLMAFWERL